MAAAATPSPYAFTSTLHILAEHAEWAQLSSNLEEILRIDAKDGVSTRGSQQTDKEEYDDNDYNDGADADGVKSNMNSNAGIHPQIDLLKKQLQTGEGPHSWTPLMLSCARAPPHIIEKLLKCSPESAHLSDRSGTFPLHFVCSWWDGDDDSNDSSSEAPEGFDDPVEDTSGFYYRRRHNGEDNRCEKNLHKVLRMLVKVCPKVLTYQNQWGMTPLHCIFDRDDLPSAETLKILLGLSKGGDDDDHFLGGIKYHRSEDGDKDTSGDDDDHDDHDDDENKSNDGEVENDYDEDGDNGGEDDESIENIIYSYALEALTKSDSNSFLPIHIAASKGASEEVLRTLISLFPQAAAITTANGDLPLHLLQYWAEDEAKHCGVGVGVGDTNTIQDPNFNSGNKSNWLFESGVFRVTRNSLFQSVSVGQIESLLEPLCFGFKSASMTSIIDGRVDVDGNNNNNNNHNNNNKSIGGQSMYGRKNKNKMHTISESGEIDAGSELEEYERNTINLASRLPGSRNVYLPIHIASEHGVSFQILSALCEQYPEGVATPQPIGKSVFGSSSRSSSNRSLGSMGDDSSKRWPQEMYAIEIFESGRAGLLAAKILHMQKRHISNSDNRAITNSTFATSSIDMNQIVEELKSFDDRSDLLFAYFPDAVPSKYRDDREERRKQNVARLERLVSNRHDRLKGRKRVSDLYRNDAARIRRLEQRIRNEALQPYLHEFSVTSKLVWLWMFHGVNDPENKMRGNHQGSIGRIITNLSKSSLLKLSYYVHLSKTKSGSLPEDLESLRFVPCIIQGRSILDVAKDRAAGVSAEEMLSLDREIYRDINWQSVVCEYLSASDGLKFNSICRKTKGSGLRYLAENKLFETGRTWNFSPHDDGDSDDNRGHKASEFWQHLGTHIILPNCTHTVVIKYYLEVSEDSYSSTFKGVSGPVSLEQTKGGLMVASEVSCPSNSSRNDLWGEQIEPVKQRKLLHSKLRTRSGCEVSLSFRYRPGMSYSLRAYGPPSGGRVSVSNARIQQIIYSVDRYNRTPLHILLSSKDFNSDIPIAAQVKMIVDGIPDSKDGIPIHLALKFGASVEILEALIEMNPSSLLKRDEQGCTPLHYVFLVSNDVSPTLGVVKTLLTTPGDNAARLKDSQDRLPLHIAAERGASAAILELLMEANTDGCYRKNRDGDLPLHLLVRSGKATSNTVEMLISPMVDSETICGIPGSQGLELPLHIAAEYNCSYKVMESLLISFGEAASIPRRKSNIDGQSHSPMYALDIFEANRKKEFSQELARNTPFSGSVRSFARSHSGLSHITEATEEVVRLDMEKADFDLRSDLIFVFYPIAPAMGNNDKAYRKDINRIRRLQNLIRREAISCAEFRTVNDEANMSEMALLAWSFFCTFDNPSDPNDEYSETVGQILKGLSNPVVHILADVRNPYSSPTPHMPVLECATLKCKRLISSRLLFAGRFTLKPNNAILHKSEDCLIVSAMDHGMEEAFKRFVATFKQEEELKDIDDLASCNSNPICQMLSFGDDAQSLFVDFAVKLGYDEDAANNQYDKLVLDSLAKTDGHINHIKHEKKEMTLEIFRQFCDTHKVDNTGIRDVVIKFMKNRTQFLREKVVRARLNLSKADWCIFPIIEDYDVDRVEDHHDVSSRTFETSRYSEKNTQEASGFGRRNWAWNDTKDSIFAMDVIENYASGCNFSSFKYAFVMPRGDKNLLEVLLHEDLDGVDKRDLLRKVGQALNELHSECVVHGNLTASNILRIGSHVGLVDFESATLFKYKEDSSVLSDKAAGISQRISSGVLPPELIARINLSLDKVQLQRYESHWSEISNDSIDFNMLNSDDVHIISSLLESFQERDRLLNRSHGTFGSMVRKICATSVASGFISEEGWREQLSEALQDISVDDLPDSLAECETIEDLRTVWCRLKANAQIWEKVRPRISRDGRFAYVVKCYNDIGNGNYDELPYDLVVSSCMMDIWAFGLLIFSMCSQSSLFHTTIDGDLHNIQAYEDLFNWNYEIAQQKISDSIKDPLAQDLLLKLLVPEDERISSMDLILQHPFFGPSSSVEAHNILEEYEERQLKSIEMSRMQEIKENIRNEKQRLSMEKHCKVLFDRLDDIMFPTGLILLPYQLEFNRLSNVLEIPRDQQSLSLGVMIGDQLIKLNTVLAKLSFWLRVKENLSQKGGGEFKAKVMSWIQRAKSEGSQSIAKEIVSAVACDQRFEGICIEMLDEEMSISNARAFIRDPMKAAAFLLDGIIDTLLRCYSSQSSLYLIDEFRGVPAMNLSDTSTNTYPLQIKANEKDFKEGLVPFMIMTMMIATSFDGLDGISRLLGLPTSEGIPPTWVNSNVGFIPMSDSKTELKSIVVQFATLYGILRQNKKELALRQTRNYSTRSTETYDSNSDGAELAFLQAFFRARDPQGNFAGLRRICDRNDSSLTFWTAESALDDQEPMHNEEFAQALRRLEKLQEEIEDKKKLEEEINVLNKRINEIKKEKDARLLRRSQKLSSRMAMNEHNEYQGCSTSTRNPPPDVVYNSSTEFSTRWNTSTAQSQRNTMQENRASQEQQLPTNPTPHNTPADIRQYNDAAQVTDEKPVYYI